MRQVCHLQELYRDARSTEHYVYVCIYIYIHTHIHIYIRVFVCKIQNVEYKIGVKESDKWYDVQIDGMYIWRRNSKEAV